MTNAITLKQESIFMNYRLLIFICMISTCFSCVSASTHHPKQVQDANWDAFFQSLIKNITTDDIEYKDGKIIMYVSPYLGKIAIDGFCTAVLAMVSIFSMCSAVLDYNQKEIQGVIIFTALSLFFAFLAAIEASDTYTESMARWSNKIPLLTISQEGITYKDWRTRPWSDIKEIMEFHVRTLIYDNHGRQTEKDDPSLKILGLFGKEMLKISYKNNDFPVSFDELASILSKTLEYVKEKRAAS